MEDVLARELTDFDCQDLKVRSSGVSIRSDLRTAYRICLWSRTASRVLLILKEFPVSSQASLYNGIKAMDWSAHFTSKETFAVHYTQKSCNLFPNTHFAVLKVKDAVADNFRERSGVRPDVNTREPDVRINVHVNSSQARVSLDLSGQSLHKRGYRSSAGEAPLKENLAAGLLYRSGWPEVAKQCLPLMDIFCGSGTILIEGALMASGTAPGLIRGRWGFSRWLQHDQKTWDELIKEAHKARQAGRKNCPPIIGSDLDASAVRSARINAKNAGLDGLLTIIKRDARTVCPPEGFQPGLLLCNPPYGERMEDRESAAELYRLVGNNLKDHFQLWKAGFILSDPELGFRFGIRSRKPVFFYNGALECRLLLLKIRPQDYFSPKPFSLEERLQIVREKSGKSSGSRGSEMFANRLKKNLKHISRWIRKNEISCYRIYDADMPEYSLAADVYECEEGKFLHVQEYEAPETVDPRKADERLSEAMFELSRVIETPMKNIFLKVRKKQRSKGQYIRKPVRPLYFIVEETGCRFYVELSAYLDTGIFLDHRPIRQMIRDQAKGRSFLNLFGYTGTATVQAAAGGADCTCTVDLSNTYLKWAAQNMELNGFKGKHDFVRSDCTEWLDEERKSPRKYGLIFLDPPTFSNSKKMENVFDIQRDHKGLIRSCMDILESDGLLIFSTNFRRFKIDQKIEKEFEVKDMTGKTIPRDFERNKKIHYCWMINHRING